MNEDPVVGMDDTQRAWNCSYGPYKKSFTLALFSSRPGITRISVPCSEQWILTLLTMFGLAFWLSKNLVTGRSPNSADKWRHVLPSGCRESILNSTKHYWEPMTNTGPVLWPTPPAQEQKRDSSQSLETICVKLYIYDVYSWNSCFSTANWTECVWSSQSLSLLSSSNEKGLDRNSNPDLCDPGAVLDQLSYEAN